MNVSIPGVNNFVGSSYRREQLTDHFERLATWEPAGGPPPGDLNDVYRGSDLGSNLNAHRDFKQRLGDYQGSTLGEIEHEARVRSMKLQVMADKVVSHSLKLMLAGGAAAAATTFALAPLPLFERVFASAFAASLGGFVAMVAVGVGKSELLERPARSHDQFAGTLQAWGSALANAPEAPEPVFDSAALTARQKREVAKLL